MPTDHTQHIKPQGGAIDESIDPQEYARLLDLYDSSFRNIAEGEVVKGTVLKVTPSEVIVDVGYKSEGIIAIDEFVDETGQIAVQPGDIVDVLLERTEDRDGYVVLSREKAEKMKSGTMSRRPTPSGRSSSAASSSASRVALPSTSASARSCRARRSTSGPSATSTPCAGRSCGCVIKVNKKRGNILRSRKVLLEKRMPRRKSTRSTPSPRARSSPAWSRTSPITVRSSIWAASMAGSTSRTCRGAASLSVGALQGQRRDRRDGLKDDPSSERVSLGHNSSRTTRGRMSSSVIRLARV